MGRSFGETSSRAAQGFKSPRTRSSRRAGSRGRTTRTITRIPKAAAATGGVCNSLSYFVSLWVSALLPRLQLPPVFHTVGAASRPRRNPGRPGRQLGRWNWSPRLMRWRCRPRQAASSVPSETSFQNLSPPAVQRASSKFIPTYSWLPVSALNNSLQSTESGFGSEPSPSRERPDGGLRLPPGPRPSPGQGLRPLVLGTTSTSSSHGGTGRRCQLVHHNNSRPFRSLRKCAWVAY